MEGRIRDAAIAEAVGLAAGAGAPGMYFIGDTNPIRSNLRERAIDSRKIAKELRFPRRSRCRR